MDAICFAFLSDPQRGTITGRVTLTDVSQTHHRPSASSPLQLSISHMSRRQESSLDSILCGQKWGRGQRAGRGCGSPWQQPPAQGGPMWPRYEIPGPQPSCHSPACKAGSPGPRPRSSPLPRTDVQTTGNVNYSFNYIDATTGESSGLSPSSALSTPEIRAVLGQGLSVWVHSSWPEA